MTDSTNLFIPDALIDVSLPINDGYNETEAQSEDTTDAYRALGARDFPEHLWISPGTNYDNWKNIAREHDKHGTWAESYRLRFTNQSPTHECVSHSGVQGFEAAWIATCYDPKYAVFFSMLSVYAECNPNQWGGTTLNKFLRIITERGILPEYHGPRGPNTQRELFKHTLHGTAGRGSDVNSSGPFLQVSRFPQGWRDTARHFRPDEVINPDSWQQMACLILGGPNGRGRVVCVGRNGHAIPYNKLAWRAGEKDPYWGYPDSYNIYRWDSTATAKKAVQSAYCIWTVVTPDSWKRPAGDCSLKDIA